jgi:hypothetical protein
MRPLKRKSLVRIAKLDASYRLKATFRQGLAIKPVPGVAGIEEFIKRK